MSTPSARTGGSLDAWFKISQRGSTVPEEKPPKEKKEDVPKKKKGSSNKRCPVCGRRMKPVSYTHLDVYKRQEYIGIREIRKHAAWYTAGYPHGARLRVAINQVENYEQLETLLKMCIRDRGWSGNLMHGMFLCIG